MRTGVLFDLDGTLLDTLEDLKDSVNYALSLHGCPPRTLEEVRRFVGNGAGVLIRLAAEDREDWPDILADFRAHYGENCQRKTKPYRGIPAALAAIGEKYPLAIVSNKPDAAVKRLCRAFFPGILALGEQPGCPRKPDPAMLSAAMAQLGVDGCVYVGDSEVDIATGKNAGVPVLSVLWGFRDRDALESGTHFCSSPSRMPEEIDRMTEEYYGK